MDHVKAAKCVRYIPPGTTYNEKMVILFDALPYFAYQTHTHHENGGTPRVLAVFALPSHPARFSQRRPIEDGW